MRQKFVISQNGDNSRLKIREYAVIDKDPKKIVSPTLAKGKFTLLCEETYEGERIASTISKGVGAMVALLRTHNIFPIEPNATRIAESVMALYASSDKGPVELFFDDLDFLEV